MKKILALIKKVVFLFSLLTITFLNSESLFAQEKIIIKNKYLTVSISQFGAELKSLKENKSNTEYIWPSKKPWPKSSPIMFPVAVRFKGDNYTFEKKNYNMPMLGFIHSSMGEVKKISESSVSFIFKSNAESLNVYPFDFLFKVTYTLKGKDLVKEFFVENLSKYSMYFDLGDHPGFVLPSKKGKTRKDYEMVFHKPMTLNRFPINKGLADKKSIPFLKNESRLNLADKRMVGKGGRLIKLEPLTTIGIAEKGKKPFIELNFGDFVHVGLWPPAERSFICFEPMLGHHDFSDALKGLEQKNQLTTLKPSSSAKYAYTISVK